MSRNVSRLLVEAFELRTTACLLGGHVAVSVTGCSQELLVDAERFGPRRSASNDTEAWDYVLVANGLVTFFGEHRPLSRASRGTGAPEDNEHTKSTVQMARIADGEGS